MDSPPAGPRVLVVEDEVLVSWVAQDMLMDLGCVVIGPAVSVALALAMVEAEAIDAALLDINLDGELSYPVADALAARGVPYAFVSGYDRDRLPEAYRAVPYLQKPLRPAQLEDEVARLLGAGRPVAGEARGVAPPASSPPGSSDEPQP